MEDVGWTYEWDALNRLVKVYKTPSTPTLIGEYTYDALGRRIRKDDSNSGLSGTIGNGTTDYLYNTQWQCVEERNGSDVMTRQYVWGLYIDELVYMNLQNAQGPSMSNGHKFPVQDLLYRTAAVFPDDDLVPDEVYDYDAYGNTLIFNAPGTASNWWANNATQTKVPNCEALFTGQHYDPESEIYLYRTRYYTATLGRFLSRDSAGFDTPWNNLLQYVQGSPAGRIDPDGRNPLIAMLPALIQLGASAGVAMAPFAWPALAAIVALYVWRVSYCIAKYNKCIASMKTPFNKAIIQSCILRDLMLCKLYCKERGEVPESDGQKDRDRMIRDRHEGYNNGLCTAELIACLFMRRWEWREPKADCAKHIKFDLETDFCKCKCKPKRPDHL